MSPGVSYSIPGNAIYERMFKSVPHDNKADIPFETYLRNEKGEEYIVKNVFSAEWRNDALVITNSRTLLTRPERWSDYKN